MSKRDITIVSKFLRAQYGRSLEGRIGTCRELAEQFVEGMADEGRLGDADPVSDGWEPCTEDIDEFAGYCGSGMTRMWRQQEIATYAMTALARAGRLLPRP